jgi:ribose 5-phosphate isomerase B
MKVAIGADHAGVEAKGKLLEVIRALGHEAVDVGTCGTESVDYPDFAALVARKVAAGECERGVLVCGTGIGMSIAANKVDGIRAALVGDDAGAELSRRHNDANVFCAGARTHPAARLAELLRTWLSTPFDGGRHERRIGKIRALEQG